MFIDCFENNSPSFFLSCSSFLFLLLLLLKCPVVGDYSRLVETDPPRTLSRSLCRLRVQ